MELAIPNSCTPNAAKPPSGLAEQVDGLVGDRTQHRPDLDAGKKPRKNACFFPVLPVSA
jgi:hypothetical protein